MTIRKTNLKQGGVNSFGVKKTIDIKDKCLSDT